jgi:hypothetical protein
MYQEKAPIICLPAWNLKWFPMTKKRRNVVLPSDDEEGTKMPRKSYREEQNLQSLRQSRFALKSFRVVE